MYHFRTTVAHGGSSNLGTTQNSSRGCLSNTWCSACSENRTRGKSSQQDSQNLCSSNITTTS